MLYLNKNDVMKLGVDWRSAIDTIEQAVHCLETRDFAQPIKPYLRYRNSANRIIAMPAFAGGDINVAGIKWIASFPDNINKGLDRAHSVTILNNADTGVPDVIFNTALLSIIRTAATTGLIIRYFEKARPFKDIKVGITGWGPIGRHHYTMLVEQWGDKIAQVFLYDLKGIDKSTVRKPPRGEIVIADSWQEAYQQADIFITCTVSRDRYINLPPEKGSLQLNVSLRDYKTDVFQYVKDGIIVDDWEEVCRQNTDIELFHKERGLMESHVMSMTDVVINKGIDKLKPDTVVMFNPMGMAVFDMAIGKYYKRLADEHKTGTRL